MLVFWVDRQFDYLGRAEYLNAVQINFRLQRVNLY